MNKTKLIESIIIEHKKLEAALAKRSLKQMDSSLPVGVWTVKETLVHITFWEQTLLTDYARWKRGEHPVELQGQAGVDAVNADVLLKAKTMTVQKALEDFPQSYRQVVDWLDGLDPVELDRPFMYGMSLGEFIAEDTWKHYGEHLSLLAPAGTD